MGTIGAVMKGEPRMNAESIVESTDCLRVGALLIVALGKEMELGFVTERLVAQSREVIKYVLKIELVP
jgi:hypothetical protein